MTEQLLPLIGPFSMGGYRSFGKDAQRFERLGKINLFIGQNNSGKSNILRFLLDLYPKLAEKKGANLELLDRHMPNAASLTFGLPRSLRTDEKGNYTDFVRETDGLFNDESMRSSYGGNLLQVLKRKAELEGTTDAWFYFGADQQLVDANWQEAFRVLDDRVLLRLWTSTTNKSGGGSRDAHWYPETLRRIAPPMRGAPVVLIPAIRRIGIKGSSEDWSGDGIIERLAKLQNPTVHNQRDKQRFAAVNKFLQTVTDNSSATLEIPHDKDTILVHMDGKTLPLDRLGTGLHEVVILASAATILEGTVICMEEPELHLNPILQKKLVRYLAHVTSNQYFITTHSAALMDTPGAEIYHITLSGGQSVVERVTSDARRFSVCEDLGYHPSDLMQANCVIWVEGPSDRLYLNHWIRHTDTDLVEGIHYSIMFYGGRLAAHVTGEDIESMVDDFISLRRINRRGVILIDSDKFRAADQINDTKARLVAEFDKGPGHAWVSAGREIENYLPDSDLRDALTALVPTYPLPAAFGKYDKVLTLNARTGKKSEVRKMDVARYIASRPANLDRMDLRDKLEKLVGFIRDSNPGVQPIK